MQSSAQRRRLLKAMYAVPLHGWMVLAKCAAGLAVIVLIALIGKDASIDASTPTPRPAATAAAAGGGANVRAEPHRKKLFDERRSRYEAGANRNSVAGKAVKPANERPLALR